MMKIALTGGIASGKSTVTALFRAAGVPVVDCDALVSDNYGVGKPIYEAVLKAFGDAYLTLEGEVDKAKLGQLIFNDPKARERLNGVTHPIVKSLVDKVLQYYESQGFPFAVVDIPLLFETGSEAQYDGVIVVSVEEQIQQKRLMDRNGWTLEEAGVRILAQMPLADKRQRAHWLIDNSGDLHALEVEVDRVLKEIVQSVKNINKKG